MIDGLVRWGAPVALVALSLAHPIPAGKDVAGSLSPVLVRWQTVHIVQLAVFPLVALAAYRLLPIAAAGERQVARIAFSTFAIAAAAYDSLAGLGTGSVVAVAGHDPARAPFVNDYFAHRVVEPTFMIVYLVTGISWLAGMAAVGLGLRRQGESWAMVGLLVPACALAIDHIPPFGVVAMLGLLAVTAAVSVPNRRLMVGGFTRQMAAIVRSSRRCL